MGFENITIIQDTRQQAGKDDHVLEYFESQGIRLIRSKLYVGDYALAHNMKTIVDRKKDLVECGSNICNKEDHERFREELKKAQEIGIKLYILIEDEHIYNLDGVKYYQCPRYKSNQYKVVNGQRILVHKKGDKMCQVNFEALGKAMKTMEEKYGCKFMFSKRADFGANVLKLLLESEKK